jgi:hypothetical protein
MQHPGPITPLACPGSANPQLDSSEDRVLQSRTFSNGQTVEPSSPQKPERPRFLLLLLRALAGWGT